MKSRIARPLLGFTDFEVNKLQKADDSEEDAIAKKLGTVGTG